MEKTRRTSCLGGVIIVGIAAGIIAWLYANEVTIRANLLVVVVLSTVFALGIWWPLWPGRPRKEAWKGVGMFLLYCVVAFGVFTALFRVEGTVSGSGLWKVVPRWTPEKGSGLEALPGEVSVSQGEDRTEKAIEAGVRDMTDFLGPDRNGIIPPAFVLEEDWKVNPPREVWRRKIGVGWSGFSVAGGRAVTLEQRGDKQRGDVEFVACYDVLTGEPLWSHAKPATKEVDPDGMGGPGPRATPVIEGDRVYATSGGGVLDCIDLRTGVVVWSRNVLKDLEAGLPMWGKSNAPLVTGDRVIVTGGQGGKGCLAAYDKMSGDPLWSAGSDSASYSSPVLATLGGKEQVISVNQGSVTGHDPGSGAVLWQFDWRGSSPKVGQPIAIGGDRVLVTAAYGMGSFLLSVKRKGEGWEAEELWESIKTLRTKFSSATVIGEYAYAIDDGTFSCASLNDGRKQWKDGRYKYGQQIAIGNLILIQAESGDVVLVRADPEKLVELSQMKALSSKTWNPPCLAGRYLLVRNDEEAVCFELPVETVAVVERD